MLEPLPSTTAPPPAIVRFVFASAEDTVFITLVIGAEMMRLSVERPLTLIVGLEDVALRSSSAVPVTTGVLARLLFAAVIGEGIIPGGMEIMDRPAVAAAEAFVHAGYPLDCEVAAMVPAAVCVTVPPLLMTRL